MTALTEKELQTLRDLQERQIAAQRAEQEAIRANRRTQLASVEALVKLVGTAKVDQAIDAVLNDTNLDFDTKQKVQNFRTSLTYSIGTLKTELESLGTPVPMPAPSVEGVSS